MKKWIKNFSHLLMPSVCATTTMSLTTWKSLACYVKQPQSQSLSLVLVVKEVFHFAQILIGKQVYGKPPQ